MVGAMTRAAVMEIEVFSFRDGSAGRGEATNVCVVRREHTEHVLPLSELDAVFRGYVLYEAEDGAEFVGVWGGRNASRLRRLLRERGASLQVRRSSPEARLKRWVTHGKAKVG